MNMRVLTLLQMRRYDDAERLLRRDLAEDPNNADAHGFLALCLSNQDRVVEALEETHRVIELEPAEGFSHYVHARVLLQGNDDKAALAAIETALHLDPENADYFAVKASALLGAGNKWQAALEATEHGLRLEPENEECLNIRSIVLRTHGEDTDAEDIAEEALRQHPDSSYTHDAVGWGCIRSGNLDRAYTHFREALRLEPNNESARDGLLTVMKARNPFYRVTLKGIMWLGHQPPNIRYTIIGLCLAFLFFSKHFEGLHPALGVALPPLRVLLLILANATWLNEPLGDALICLSKDGRRALPNLQRIVATAMLPLMAICCWAVISVSLHHTAQAFYAFLLSATLLFALASLHGAESEEIRRQAIFDIGSLGLPALVLLATSIAGSPWVHAAEVWLLLVVIVWFAFDLRESDMSIFQQERLLTQHRWGMIAALVAGLGLAGWLGAPYAKTPYPIGPATTHITAPTTPEGSIDYLAALNDPVHRGDHNLTDQLEKLRDSGTWTPWAGTPEDFHSAILQRNLPEVHKLLLDHARRNEAALASLNDWATTCTVSRPRFTLTRNPRNKPVPAAVPDAVFLEVVASACLLSTNDATQAPLEKRVQWLIDCRQLCQLKAASPSPNDILIGLAGHRLFIDARDNLLQRHPEQAGIFAEKALQLPPPIALVDEYLRLHALHELQILATTDRLPAGLPKMKKWDVHAASFLPDATPVAEKINEQFDRWVERLQTAPDWTSDSFWMKEFQQAVALEPKWATIFRSRDNKRTTFEQAVFHRLTTPIPFLVATLSLGNTKPSLPHKP